VTTFGDPANRDGWLRAQNYRKGPGHGAPREVFGPNSQARQNAVHMASVALPYSILKRLKQLSPYAGDYPPNFRDSRTPPGNTIRPGLTLAKHLNVGSKRVLDDKMAGLQSRSPVSCQQLLEMAVASEFRVWAEAERLSSGAVRMVGRRGYE